MQAYIGNRWVKIGLTLVVLGWGPLIAIIVLAALRLWPDPNPNPTGAGLLFFVTFWPAVICLGVGAAQVARQRMQGTSPTSSRAPSLLIRVGQADWPGHPVVRTISGIVGLILVVKGGTAIQHDHGRGAASAIVLGVAALYWTVTGRLPLRLRR